jgi:predicted secreted protein
MTVTAALIAAGVAMVCASALTATAAATVVPSNTTVTPANDGQTVTIAKGTKLTISLANNNPSTGYSWNYKKKPDPAILQLVSDKTTAPPATNPPIVGAAAPRTIVYKALKAGATKIVLAYFRTFETKPPADTLALTVRVLSTAGYKASFKTVTPKNDGQTVTIRKGGQLTISLKDNNPSTGYSWKFQTKPSESILKLVSDKTKAPAQTNPPTAGAPAPRTIIYKALQTGKTKIALQYVGPGGQMGDSLAITVKVV